MTRRSHLPVMAAAVIHRNRQGQEEVIIGKLREDPYQGKWCFPWGPVEDGEAPEQALRRALRSTLCLGAHIRFGQPPFDQPWDEVMCRWRYYFCDSSEDIEDRSPQSKANLDYYAEVRWVNKGDLREYEFDPVSQQVVDWILEEAS